MIPLVMPKRSEELQYPKIFAEFFAGIGLMRMGLEQTGWSVAYANDIDPDKKEMYEAQFGNVENTFHLGDIHHINPQSIPNVTLATASFPCNDLSLAGSRNGLAGKQSSAYWGFIKILESLGRRRPPIILLENVIGFLNSHGGKDFEEALLALNRLGYVTDAFEINAARFVPQSRVRLFVIGRLSGYEEDILKETPVFYECETRPKALAQFIFTHPEINWVMRDLPPLPMSATKLKSILEDLPRSDWNWWSRERTDYLAAQMSAKHRSQLLEMSRRKKYSYGTVFRRIRRGKSMAELRIDGIAGCLRTPRGGSGRQILVKAGYGNIQARLLTPRECARLMGANDFNISVPLNQALFGFGDAVCVPVITWIAKNYIDPLLRKFQSKREIIAYEMRGEYAVAG